jgi:3'-5' exoribonuclease
MKSTFVCDLIPGTAVDELFALRKVELRDFPTGKMIILEIGDQSGRIKGVIWSGSPEIMKNLIIGEVYNIKGTVTTYRGEIQITVEKFEPEKVFDPRDFLPSGPLSAAELEAMLSGAIGSVSDIDYRNLLEAIFGDDKFRQGFLSGVGGKLWHHNYIGGLAEHTLSVYELCQGFSEHYGELDRDLILTGALLHDIGKVDSYSLGNYIEYSDSGRLIGHIVIGDEIINSAIDKINGFPQPKKLKIRHLVLSHQGSPEQSSPIPPMMPEGIALYIADLLDSKLAAMRRIKKNEHRPGVRWSNYVNLLDRHIYFGDDGDDNEKNSI